MITATGQTCLNYSWAKFFREEKENQKKKKVYMEFKIKQKSSLKKKKIEQKK